MYKVINIDTLSKSDDTRQMVEDLREGEPTRYEILSGGVDVGYVELSKESYKEDPEESIEIRWLIIYEQYREKGCMGKLIEKIKLLGVPLIGEIVELELREVWESVGAEFVNEWDFVIR